MSTNRVAYLFQTVLTSQTNFLQNISIRCKLYAYLWLCLSGSEQKYIYSFQINLLYQPNQTETGYFQVRIRSLCS